MADWQKGFATYGLEPGVELAPTTLDGINSTWQPVAVNPTRSRNWKFFGLNDHTSNTAYPTTMAWEFEWDADDYNHDVVFTDPGNVFWYAYGTVAEITAGDTTPLQSELDSRVFPAYVDGNGSVVLMRIRYGVLIVPKPGGGYEEAFEIPAPPE